MERGEGGGKRGGRWKEGREVERGERGGRGEGGGERGGRWKEGREVERGEGGGKREGKRKRWRKNGMWQYILNLEMLLKIELNNRQEFN